MRLVVNKIVLVNSSVAIPVGKDNGRGSPRPRQVLASRSSFG